MPDQSTRLWILWLLWAGYCVLGFYFLFSRNPSRKRRLYRPYLITADTFFLLIMVALGFPWPVVFLAIPLVGIATVLNLRQLRFCDGCGTTNWTVVPFRRPRHCSDCGAPLSDGTSRRLPPGGRAA